MAEKPPTLDRFEQGRAAAEVGRDQQKQFQPYGENEEAGPGNLMKGDIGEPTPTGQPAGSPETGPNQQTPEQLKDDNAQRRAAEKMERDRQRSNARRNELNQSLRPAGALKRFFNQKKIKQLTKEKKEKDEELTKKKKKINKLKVKWWQWLILLFKLLLSIFGIGVPLTALQLEEMSRKSLEVKLLKKQAKELKKDIDNINIKIYNLQNVIKLQAQKDIQEAQTSAPPA